jgi:predicted alpha/beta superfamily hydrolase
MKGALAFLVGTCLAVQVSWAQDRFVTQDVPSRFLDSPRTVRVYLPASYRTGAVRRYPVLYLHDGQNVFSTAGTNVCFGWGNWELDRTADELARVRRMEEIILVGVDNSPARFAEYGGRHRAAGTNTNKEFENYTAFLVQELKPKIDAEYRTRPEPAHTGVLGSSMGGICSVLLAW